MKRFHFFLMTLIACSFFQVAQAQPYDTLRRQDAHGWEFFQVRRNGIVLSEGYNEKGVAQGTWITYWDNGYPHFIINYLNGKRNGVHMQISQQGYTEMVEHFVNDLLEGPRRVYQPGSSFISEEAFYSEGQKHGGYSKHYNTGKPQEEAHYNHGLRDGKSTWYYEDGEKAAEYNYRNGTIDGEVASYYKNGKVNEFGVYKDNEQTGLWKEFYENGNLKAEGKYEHGEKEGAWKEYDQFGKFVKTVKYVKGKVK